MACCLFGFILLQIEQGDHGRTMILHDPLPNMLNRLVTIVEFSGQCFGISPISIVDLFFDAFNDPLILRASVYHSNLICRLLVVALLMGG